MISSPIFRQPVRAGNAEVIAVPGAMGALRWRKTSLHRGRFGAVLFFECPRDSQRLPLRRIRQRVRPWSFCTGSRLLSVFRVFFLVVARLWGMHFRPCTDRLQATCRRWRMFSPHHWRHLICDYAASYRLPHEEARCRMPNKQNKSAGGNSPAMLSSVYASCCRDGGSS